MDGSDIEKTAWLKSQKNGEQGWNKGRFEGKAAYMIEGRVLWKNGGFFQFSLAMRGMDGVCQQGLKFLKNKNQKFFGGKMKVALLLRVEKKQGVEVVIPYPSFHFDGLFNQQYTQLRQLELKCLSRQQSAHFQNVIQRLPTRCCVFFDLSASSPGARVLPWERDEAHQNILFHSPKL